MDECQNEGQKWKMEEKDKGEKMIRCGEGYQMEWNEKNGNRNGGS